MESEVQLKYQIAQLAEIINWDTPIRKALSHRYPNKLYRNMYIVSLVLTTSVKKVKSVLYYSVPIDMILAAI